jgi:hypothetical protein
MGNELKGWERLRHGGLLLDPTRQRMVASHEPPALSRYHADSLRRLLSSATSSSTAETSTFVTFVLEIICGFGAGTGAWKRGSQIGAEWARRAVTGESVKPRQLWTGNHGASLPVFVDDAERIGIGHGRRSTSHVLQWLRGGLERLALLTNGRQWRLIFAGLDFDAWCEWDVDLWLEEGDLGTQVDALRVLVAPAQFTPTTSGATPPLLQAVLDSRKGQAELSAALGERVREAVELLVQSHSAALAERCGDVEPSDTYRAAVRVVMRMVVVLFAESRELLPRDNALYHGTYGLSGLLGDLERTGARGGNRLKRQYTAWPRVLALFRLVAEGSHHPALPVPAYGGDLFASAPDEPTAGLDRALRVFETACFDQEVLSDHDALVVLERLTRTRVKVRQGRASTWIQAPVDFSDLSSEYIGILYEGLLDFELRTAPAGDPVIFLSVGNQPALPLSRLEAMSDATIKELLQKMKDTSSGSADGEAVEEDAENVSEASGDEEEAEDADSCDEADSAPGDDEEPETEDARHVTRSRAEQWARRAVAAGRLVRPARGTSSDQRAAHEQQVARKARQLVTRVVLPGERYLVRWGGTRKGSGSFYTRPGLAVPLVQRTLRPLAWDPPKDESRTGLLDAPPSQWVPKRPEEILAVTVCDPACGSGTFPIGALRFLTDALYASLHHHGRISTQGDQALVRLLGDAGHGNEEQLGEERLPCRPDDPTFEPRLKAVLRRHVVERCIYGVDLDPLAVELCRLALWIETMDRTLPFSFIDHKIKCGNGLIGAWFDQFQHYPVMAWKNREGGDKGHSHGVHFEKDARGKALKAWAKDVLTPDLQRFLGGRTLFDADQLAEAGKVHDAALHTLASLHDLPVQDAAERGRRYRELLLGSPAWQNLKAAMDLWCACWFWPADQLRIAPLPSTLVRPSESTLSLARQIADQKRFFHWELEFPDVFREEGAGFHAMLGNPPWETLQPNSKEYFSNLDPLFRTYGKQDALGKQTELFSLESIEADWLRYCGDFAALSNHMKYAAIPFGDPSATSENADRFTISRGALNATLHERWRGARAQSKGYVSPEHPFMHRGEGKAYTYKLFLELAHSLMKPGGRMGFIVPSGVYSDHGTGALRALFLDRCRWEWLFGFENREAIFDIHRSFKFNPIIVEKGGRTEAIRTAFMRRTFAEWEQAESISTPYTRAQVERFSPKSRAILEVESARDLEILEKIYANSVLLGDEGPHGWGVKYAQGDFNMTSDSKLFPPRAKWEAQGYRPDEYSRWLKGNWRPIVELWPELGIDPCIVVPAEVVLENWLFDSTAGPEARIAGAQFVHGHLLKPGDVQRTPWRVRCAQPPYDSLPVPRAAIPAGIILSRGADAWVREGEIDDVALPLYQGKMFYVDNWSAGDEGHGIPMPSLDTCDYLMSASSFTLPAFNSARLVFRDIARATDKRTMVSAAIPALPCGNKAPILVDSAAELVDIAALQAFLGSFWADWIARRRVSGTQINWHIAAAFAMLRPSDSLTRLGSFVAGLLCCNRVFAPMLTQLIEQKRPTSYALLPSERKRLRVIANCVTAALAGLNLADVRYVLAGCDAPIGEVGNDPRGMWRVDRDLEPSIRETSLTIEAFADLSRLIEEAGTIDLGITAFLTTSGGDGWLPSETTARPDGSVVAVSSSLGPRFFDWQLAQGDAELFEEMQLHARNLAGANRSSDLADSHSRGRYGESIGNATPATVRETVVQTSLFG